MRISRQLFSVISQLPYTRFDQISDHKHEIHLYGKLSTKLLMQAANESTEFMLTKTGGLPFLMYGFRSGCPEKFETDTSVG